MKLLCLKGLVPQGSILCPLLFLIFINDMKQAVSSDLLLYSDHSFLIFQQRHASKIETRGQTCEWFLDNKLSIHFGDNKIKSILFGTKCKLYT